MEVERIISRHDMAADSSFASIRAIVGYLSKTLFQSTYKFKLRIVDPARINFCVSARVHICDKDSCFDGVPFDDPPHHPQLNYYNGNVEKIVISCWFLVELWTKMIHLINRMRNHLSQLNSAISKIAFFSSATCAWLASIYYW